MNGDGQRDLITGAPSLVGDSQHVEVRSRVRARTNTRNRHAADPA
jgi:hypothetical protein